MLQKGMYKIDLFAGGVLAIAAYKLVFAIDRIMDIGLRDETIYLSNGLSLLSEGWPHPDYSPLYSGWYHFLSLFQSNPLSLYYLNFQLLAILLPVLCYVVLRRLSLYPIAAMVIAAYFMISHANLPTTPKPCHFSLLLVLAFLALSTAIRSFTTASLFLALGALVSSLARPEMFLAFVLFTALYLVLLVRGFRTVYRSRGLPAILLRLGISVLLLSIIVLFAFINHERSFLAFAQHFSQNWVRWTGSDLNPWIDFEMIVSGQFGPAGSVAAAVANEPTVFLKHVGDNIVRTPVTLAKLWLIHYNIIFPVCPRPCWVAEGALLLAVIVVSLAFLLRRSAAQIKKAFAERASLILHCGLLCVPGFVASAVIFPRRHYLLIPSVLIVVVLAVCLLGDVGRRAKAKSVILVGVLILALTPCLSQYDAEGKLVLTSERINVKTVGFLKSLGISNKVNLLNAEGRLHVYAGADFHWIRAQEKRTGFRDFLDDSNIDMVLVTANIISHTKFRADDEWRYFLQCPDDFGFEVMRIPETERRLFVRRGVLPPGEVGQSRAGRRHLRHAP